MLGDKLSIIRQSLQLKPSVEGKNIKFQDDNKQNKPQYSINIELPETYKQALQAFKQSSGYYKLSPKKQKSSSSPQKILDKVPQSPIEQKQCQRIYLFGNPEGDYFSKPSHLQSFIEKSSMDSTKAKDGPLSKQQIAKQTKKFNNLPSIKQGNEDELKDFIKEVFETLGLVSRADDKQLPELIEIAYLKFVDMKSNGRWNLIRQYFIGNDKEQNQFHLANQNKSIIKKKSINQNNNLAEKKKVKVLEPDSASQLARTKYRLLQDLQKQIQVLTKGYNLQKYCYHTEQVEEVSIYFSFDLKFLAWQAKNKPPQVQSMQNYCGVTDGARSKNFQKYIVKKYAIDDQLAFSLIFNHRTLDLLAPSQQKKQQLIEGIKFARTFI